MIQPKLLTVLLLFFLPVSHAQNAEKEFTFGSVAPEHLTMSSHEKDTTANALVLYEKGTSKIEKNGFGEPVLSTEIIRRIKIFKKEGLDRATIEIPIRKSLESKEKERFVEAEAISINTDRTVQRLDEKDIFTENVSETHNLVKFTVPNVQEGAVIDYRYKIESPFFYNFRSWMFQWDIPKLYSRFSTSIPANYKYNIKLTGFLKLDHKEAVLKKDCFYFQGLGTADCAVSTYIMKDIPAFKEEDYMTSKYNYLSSINYELETFEGFDGMEKKFTRSWKDVDKEIKYREEIGRQARKTSYFKRLIPPEVSVLPQGVEKAKKIYYSLQEQLFWNKKNYIFTRVDVKDAFKRKSGSNAELNLILLNFLKASGFKAEFMLLSTRNNGFATKLYPIISDFNYLVVKLDIEEMSFLLDITDKNLPFGVLPFRALNGYGRVMDMDNGSYWQNITPVNNTQTYVTTRIIFSEDEPAKIRTREVCSWYHALSKRKKVQDIPEKEYMESLRDRYDKEGVFVLDEYTMHNKKDPEKQFVEDYSFRMAETPVSDILFFNPFVVEKVKENPFTLDERTYPVDFGYPFSYIHLITIDFGEHYQLKEIPKSKIMKLPDNSGNLTYKTSRNGNTLMLNVRLSLKKPLYSPVEYEGLKKIYSELISLQHKQPVVLERKL